MRLKISKKLMIVTVVLGCCLALTSVVADESSDAEAAKPVSSAADSLNQGLSQTAGEKGAGYNTKDIKLETAVMKVISYVLGLIGVILVALIVYAGFTWMTAAGNEEKVSKAKDIMIASAIGLFIILLSYGIASFIVYHLNQATIDKSNWPPGYPWL